MENQYKITKFTTKACFKIKLPELIMLHIEFTFIGKSNV